jgi:hypothetical protein
MKRYIVTVEIVFGQAVDAINEEVMRDILKEQYYESYGIDIVDSEIKIDRVEDITEDDQ